MGVDEEGKSASSSSWLARRHVIVLSALGGIVAATVLVITVSVILRPAHIEFKVESPTWSSNNTGMYLFLTVNASSSSRNGIASVNYRSVFVYLETRSKGTLERFQLTTTALPSDVDDDDVVDLYLDGKAEMSVDAWLLLVGDSKKSTLAGRAITGIGDVTVLVIAQVRFKIGVVKTRRVYDITQRFTGVKFKHIN
uniref:Late embryogenesis abundant protein LEA-2 subgroup domain-containing protein n=1 Tax=Leersia perrieri TaxID=77586 RepID=A0A0D9WL65_9ORYZ